MTNELTADQKRNINRQLREVGAANSIQTVPINASDVQVGLIVAADGTMQSFGTVPAQHLPAALRKIADAMDADLAKHGRPSVKRPGSGLLK